MTTTRIRAPRRTRGRAPSHTPPDMRYLPGIKLARGLGWFSIGLGLAELVAPRAISELTGVRSQSLIQIFGLREIVTGIGILSSAQPAGWLWARVAGDVLDVGALLTAAARDEEDGDRQRGLLAAAAVGGVAALDAMCAAQLSAACALEG